MVAATGMTAIRIWLAIAGSTRPAVSLVVRYADLPWRLSQAVVVGRAR